MKRTAICFQTHTWNSTVRKIFRKMYNDLKDRKDVDIWIVYDMTDKEEAEDIDYDNDFIHYVDLKDKMYEPYFYACEAQSDIWKADNSCSLFYDFIEKHQEYDYYMFHENDIMFVGNYNLLFDIVPYKKYDIVFQTNLCSLIGTRSWVHHQYTALPKYNIKNAYNCLQQIYFVKRKFMNKIFDEMHSFNPDELNCFFEILIPTLAFNLKGKIGNLKTWVNVYCYPKKKYAEKIFDLYNYNMPNCLVHPIKTDYDYDFMLQNTIDIGNNKRI